MHMLDYNPDDLSTPVRLAGGKVYGTLCCCFSRGVQADADIGRLRYAANLLGEKLSAEAVGSAN